MTNNFALNRKSLHLDYFRDDKNRICQVLTWHHPVDRKLCIVKYDLGESHWTSRETGLQYKRMLSSYSLEGHQENLNYFKAIEPDYLYHSSVYGVDFLAVPNERIQQYYYPEERLKEILNTEEEKLDAIEKKVKKLAELLHDFMFIPYNMMGITGSIIWKAQTEKSDIDLIIYGNGYSQDFSSKYAIIYDLFPDIKRLSPDKKMRYERSMAKKSGLPMEITSKYIAKKEWLSIYDKTDISIAFSPFHKQVPFDYGEEEYSPVCTVDVECEIINNRLGSAYPAIYQIDNCKILSSSGEIPDLPLKRILSFEGALTGYFQKGDRIIVRGLLERVRSKRHLRSFLQVILGTKECVGNEFILYPEDYEKLSK